MQVNNKEHAHTPTHTLAHNTHILHSIPSAGIVVYTPHAPALKSMPPPPPPTPAHIAHLLNFIPTAGIVCVRSPRACPQEHAPKHSAAQEGLCSRAEVPFAPRLRLTFVRFFVSVLTTKDAYTALHDPYPDAVLCLWMG